MPLVGDQSDMLGHVCRTTFPLFARLTHSGSDHGAPGTAGVGGCFGGVHGLSSLADEGVYIRAADVTIEGNNVTGSGSSPAYGVASSALDIGQLGGNSTSGGIPGFYLAGTVTTTSTWSLEAAPWLDGDLGDAESAGGLDLGELGGLPEGGTRRVSSALLGFMEGTCRRLLRI